MGLVIVQVDHFGVVEMAEHWSDAYYPNDIDVGVNPGAYSFCNLLPHSLLPKILIFNSIGYLIELHGSIFGQRI